MLDITVMVTQEPTVRIYDHKTAQGQLQSDVRRREKEPSLFSVCMGLSVSSEIQEDDQYVPFFSA